MFRSVSDALRLSRDKEGGFQMQILNRNNLAGGGTFLDTYVRLSADEVRRLGEACREATGESDHEACASLLRIVTEDRDGRPSAIDLAFAERNRPIEVRISGAKFVIDALGSLRSADNSGAIAQGLRNLAGMDDFVPVTPRPKRRRSHRERLMPLPVLGSRKDGYRIQLPDGGEIGIYKHRSMANRDAMKLAKGLEPECRPEWMRDAVMIRDECC